MTEKDKNYYMNLPYTIEVNPISPEEGGGWSACIPLLGRYACIGDGDTYVDAIENLKSRQEELIESMLEEGIKIAEPPRERVLIKPYVLRLSADLYNQIAEEAKSQGTSVNRYIVNILSKRHQDIHLRRMFERLQREIQQLYHDFVAMRGNQYYRREIPLSGTLVMTRSSHDWVGSSTVTKLQSGGLDRMMFAEWFGDNIEVEEQKNLDNALITLVNSDEGSEGNI